MKPHFICLHGSTRHARNAIFGPDLWIEPKPGYSQYNPNSCPGKRIPAWVAVTEWAPAATPEVETCLPLGQPQKRMDLDE
jgi:hypothetical protein